MNEEKKTPILSVRNVRKYFGGIKAVDGISIDVAPHTITGLIGPNGAGKTTLFNTISGFYTPDTGEILFNGEQIDGLSLHQTFHKGLCRTFQISRELKRMTVLENLMLVSPNQEGEKLWRTWFFPQLVRDQEKAVRERAEECLDLTELLHLKDEYAGNLSGGQKRLLELARPMMARPKMILFDEPGAGVNPSERRTLADRIRKLVSSEGITVLLIGHEMELVMDISDTIAVLNFGQNIARGTPEQIQANPDVIAVYLGEE